MRAANRVRAVVTGALAAALVATVAPAGAAGVPAPTVTVKVTTAQGVVLPNALFSAAWHTASGGRTNELLVDGENVPGTVTTIDALWTSQVYRTLARIPALAYEPRTSHLGAPTSTMPASVSTGFRFRQVGRPWSAWFDVSYAYQAGSPVNGLAGDLSIPSPYPGKAIQVQWRLHSEIADAAEETQSWKLLPNIP